MEFATEMDEVKEVLRTNKYPVHVGNDKGKTANYRRKCRAFVLQDESLKFVHKPNRRDLTEVRFLGVIKDRQYQLDIVVASHRGAGDSDEAVALGGHVGRDKVIDRIMQIYWWRNVTSDVVETVDNKFVFFLRPINPPGVDPLPHIPEPPVSCTDPVTESFIAPTTPRRSERLQRTESAR
ncbi:hypothetical protein Pmani_017906 [Petrolisthes manimaculis]|uniref:Integrase zinc-binding domain-containing protein n=1 Tax=Petrolisthes manimaculis TaxID=1843537 RepID=A0AAE1U9C6_9EUCA|nr:hypothetical protein Pmani_017906 [Petrolisthes manimaculis]